jgi:hypothetical protein
MPAPIACQRTELTGLLKFIFTAPHLGGADGCALRATAYAQVGPLRPLILINRAKFLINGAGGLV